MQTVTLNPAQVALNATPAEVKSRFGTYDVAWSKVTNPAGSNIVARVVNAVLAVIKNIAQHIYNGAVFLPNKIHSLLYPNAVSKNKFEDDAIEIQQDSLYVDVYETEAEELNEENAMSSSALEDLPEPVVTGINYRSWVKAGLVGAAALVGAAGVLALTSHYELKVPEFIPYFGGDKIPGAESSANLFSAAGTQINSAWTGAYDAVTSLFASSNPENPGTSGANAGEDVAGADTGTTSTPDVNVEEVLTGANTGTTSTPDVNVEEVFTGADTGTTSTPDVNVEEVLTGANTGTTSTSDVNAEEVLG